MNQTSEEESVLKIALENEIRGHKLYHQYANTLTSEMAKRVFVHRANEELKHIEDIKKFIASISMNQDINVEIMLTKESLKHTQEFFGTLIKDLKDRVKPNDDDNKSREVAMEIELKGYNYYKKCAEETNNTKLRKFFEWLMEQEQGHYLLIKNSFDYMNNPDSFYNEEEHWILEG